MTPVHRRTLVVLLTLTAVVGAQAVASQQASIRGVVIETRVDQTDNRSVFVAFDGTGTQQIDELEIEFPRGTDLPDTATMFPLNWTYDLDGRTMRGTGPALIWSDVLVRLDLGVADPPDQANVEVKLSGRRLFEQNDIVINQLPELVVIDSFRGMLAVPDVVTAGLDMPLGVLNPTRTPPGGTWNLSLQTVPDGPFGDLPVNIQLAERPTVKVPAEQNIVNDLLAGAVAAGFGRGQAPAAATGSSDNVSTANWDTAKLDEAAVQTRLINEFKLLTDGSSAAITDYMAHADAYRSTFTRVTSSSSELQALMSQFPAVVTASQRTDLALAVIQLAYGGIKGGALFWRWLTKPKQAAEAVETAVETGARLANQGDEVTTAGARAGTEGAAASSSRANGFALAEQIENAQNGALQRLAAEAGLDLQAWMARFDDATDAYVALVNHVANLRGLTSLTPASRQVLTRLVVAASNAKHGRAGSATAQEIATLRQWAQQSGFWDKLTRAASWFEEPGRLAAGGREFQQPALQFARDFSPEEIALLRALAESDDLARLASQLGGTADEVGTFIDRAGRATAGAADETPTFIDRAGRAGATPPANPNAAGNVVPGNIATPAATAPTVRLDTPTVITRAAGNTLDESATVIDRFIPAGTEGSTLLIAPQANGLRLSGSAPALTAGSGTMRLTDTGITQAGSQLGRLTPAEVQYLMGGIRRSPIFLPGSLGPLAQAGQQPNPWSTFSRGPAGDALAELGGVRTTLRAEYVDRWGDTTFLAEKPLTILPRMPTGVMPQLFDVTPLAFPGNDICVCGVFPGDSANQLLLNGDPIAPVSSSEFVTCLQLPQTLTAGSYTISFNPEGGFGATSTVQVGVLTLGGEIDQAVLFRGESTPLRIFIQGTEDALRVSLRNTTPGIITMTGGDVQVITTSGGAANDWSGMVTGTRVGDFNIDFSIDGASCPCADNTSRWGDYSGLSLDGFGGPTIGFDGSPIGPFNRLTAEAGIDTDFWLAVNGDRLPQALPGLAELISQRNGWHTIPADVARVVNKLLADGRMAVATGGTIPAAELAQLRQWAQIDGFWNWLAASRGDVLLPLTLTYSVQDIQFLEHVVASNGDLAELRNRLGPVKTTALQSLGAQQDVSAQRALAFLETARIQDASSLATQVIDYETFVNQFWGKNEVFEALKYYGAVDGEDPGLTSGGWMVADYVYGWFVSPVETASRTRYTLEAQSAYMDFLEGSGDDLIGMGLSVNQALNALRRLQQVFDSTRLTNASSVLGGAAATDLRGVLTRLQQVYDAASPAWQQSHAEEMTTLKSHIENKLKDLATAVEVLGKVAEHLPGMIQWLESLYRDPDGNIRSSTEMYNPETFIRLGSIAMYLENMAAAGFLVADAPVASPKVRGPRNANGQPMSLDDLRRGGGQ